jgi:hypothetical protein
MIISGKITISMEELPRCKLRAEVEVGESASVIHEAVIPCPKLLFLPCMFHEALNK